MPAAPRTRGFLFADLRDYTDFVETHGDHAAAELLAAYRDVVRRAVAAFDGAEIRTEGDSFYVVFDSASAAVACGLAIVSAARLARASHPRHPIRVGVGVHAGETVETDEGPVGSAVNIAARVGAVADAGEVVVTDTVRALTRTFLDVGYAPLGSRLLKGIAEPIALYRIEPTPPDPGTRPWGEVPGTAMLALAGLAALAAAVVLVAAGVVPLP